MKELMPILALDPATHMGWALSPLISGVWDLSLKRDESTGMKFMRLRAKLNELSENYRIRLVVYEAARNAAPKMQGALVHQAQLQAIIIDWATTAGIESKGYSPKEIKKWATGNGNASKDAMVAFAKKRWLGVQILDDNHADALLLWQMATLEYKFLVDAATGKIKPASAEPVSEPSPASVSSPIAVAKIPAKIERAFRKAGRAEASLADKSLFLSQLKEAGILFGHMTSSRLAKMIKGELSLAGEKKREA
jgi:Holliday junction resolvasome RuvABC endonuclease subunit